MSQPCPVTLVLVNFGGAERDEAARDLIRRLIRGFTNVVRSRKGREREVLCCAVPG
jgi:hypothetical protein